MADTDLVACLYSADDAGVGYSSTAIAMNTSRYVPPLLTLPSPTQRLRGDRESTEPAEETEVDVNLYRSRLELRFSRGPQTDAGLVFGWDRNSDIVLPQVRGISFHHCTLTFDAANRPLIKDLGSQGGTAVSYDAEAGDQIRRDFAWIIGGHEVPQGKKTTVIHFSRHLRLQIVVTGHELASPTYIENVRRFRLGTSDPEKLLGQLDLTSRPRTRPASGARTPSSGPVILRKILGEGGFGTVSHAWDVTTGEEYALKEPSSKARQNIDGLLRLWRKEGAIMERISHPNIVRLLEYCSPDSSDELDNPRLALPRLKLEYVPCGSLFDQADITRRECVDICRQVSSALEYLHAERIVHRDVKPENILIQSRQWDRIHVKLADFGIHKDSFDLTTIVGTRYYTAPEIFIESDRRIFDDAAPKKGFTAAIDLWSLGVVLGQYVVPLPRCDAAGLAWCRTIIDVVKKSLEEKPSEFKKLIATLLAWNPSDRGSATDCYRRALRLPQEIEENCWTSRPTRVSFEEEGQRTIVQEVFKGGGDPSPTTTQPTEVNSTRFNYGHDDNTIPAVSRRFRKSGAPPPETLGPERKKRKRSASADEALLCLGHGNATQVEEENASNLEPWLDALDPLGGGSSLVASILGMSTRDSTADMDNRNRIGEHVDSRAESCAERPAPSPTFEATSVLEPLTTISQGPMSRGSLLRLAHTEHIRPGCTASPHLVSKSEQEMAKAILSALH